MIRPFLLAFLLYLWIAPALAAVTPSLLPVPKMDLSQVTTDATPLTETLGIDPQTRAVLDQYRSFLAKNHLSGTAVGKTALSLASLLFTILLGFAVKKGSLLLQRELTRVQQKFELRHSRFPAYANMLRYAGHTVIAVLLVFTLTSIWHIGDLGFLKGETSTGILAGAFSIFLIITIATLLWETISAFIEYGVRRASHRKANRIRTILPIVKSILFSVFAVLFALVILSQLGINILPLLAGAGIVGVAVGFGAQTLVRDFLTGIMVVFEDLFHVGDLVLLAGVTGVVEHITLRKVRLRDGNGIVYTIPYSEIKVVQNQSRDFSYAVIDFTVPYRLSHETLLKAIADADAQIRADEALNIGLSEPVQTWIFSLSETTYTVRARVRVPAGRQQAFVREYTGRVNRLALERGLQTIPQAA